MNIMGCNTSVHPSIYNETVGKERPYPTPSPRKLEPGHLQGDYSQLQVAKHKRQVEKRQRQVRILQEADEMTYRVMEERETLSLGTRSRGTSLTSQAPSPNNNNKRSVHFHTDMSFEVAPADTVRCDLPVKETENRHTGETLGKKMKSSPQPTTSVKIEVDQSQPQAETDNSSSKRHKHKKHKKLKRKTSTLVEEGEQVEVNAEMDSSRYISENPPSPSHQTSESHPSRSSSKSDLDSKRG